MSITNVIDRCNTLPRMENLETLAARVRWARERLQLSQAALAKRAGCSQGMIGNLETGTRDKPRDPFRLATALEVSALWLYENKGDWRPSAVGNQQQGGVALVKTEDELLRRVVKMIETYRLASSNDRGRIDLIVDEISNRIAANNSQVGT
jgi:transcriptional regulator with XRE-family HTH domain